MATSKASVSLGVFACIGVLAAACLSSSARAADDAPTPQTRRDAVARALPYLERGGVEWIEERGCVSCHRVSFLTWAHAAADRKGIAIDRDKLEKWNEWSTKSSLSKMKDSKDIDGTKNLDGLAQMILAAVAFQDDARRQQTIEAFVPMIVKGQKKDGSWAAAGQLPQQKRPKSETDQVTTMWIALALGQVKDAAAKQARDKALTWLAAATPGKSTEWYAVHLLLRKQKGNDVADAVAKLKSLQNANGGWGWIAGDKSDALATGTALYALRVAGIAADDTSATRAVQSLLTTQKTDGSWDVPGTKANRKDRIEETASYWGTAWAVIALLETVP